MNLSILAQVDTIASEDLKESGIEKIARLAVTKNGAPDFKALDRKLNSLDIPESAWEETHSLNTNRELKKSYLPELDRALYTAEQRQL